MWTPLYNRLCGWFFLALGVVGLCGGQIKPYLQFSGYESWMNLSLGLIAMTAARLRLRYSVAIGFLVAFLLLTWGLLGLFADNTLRLHTEPLDTLFRFLGALWGIYVTLQDITRWRKAPEITS